jgi:hypothetical protein
MTAMGSEDHGIQELEVELFAKTGSKARRWLRSFVDEISTSRCLNESSPDAGGAVFKNIRGALHSDAPVVELAVCRYTRGKIFSGGVTVKSATLATLVLVFALQASPTPAIGAEETPTMADDPRVSDAITAWAEWVEYQIGINAVPGVSVAVVHDQELLFIDGFGSVKVR